MLTKETYAHQGSEVSLEVITATATNGAHILLLGSGHDLDPTDDILATYATKYKLGTIAFEAWLTDTQDEPRLVVHENRNKSVEDTRENAIIMNGEAGLMRYLANQNNIKFISGEPSFAKEIDLPPGKYDFDIVSFFLGLRTLPWLEQRSKAAKLAPEEILRNILDGYPASEKIYAAFVQQYEQRYRVTFNTERITPAAYNDGMMVCEPRRHRAPATPDTQYVQLVGIKEAVRQNRTKSFFTKIVMEAIITGTSCAAWLGKTHTEAIYSNMEQMSDF